MTSKQSHVPPSYDKNPPSDWAALLREHPGIDSVSVRYRTGGRARGYRDLHGRLPVSGLAAGIPHVVGKGGQPLTPDSATQVAAESWSLALAHFDEVTAAGGSRCNYQLAGFDGDGAEVDSTGGAQLRVDDGGLEETPSGFAELCGLWERQNTALHKQSTDIGKSQVTLMAGCTGLLGQLSSMISAIPASGAGPDPQIRAAEIMSGAHVAAARAAEAGASLRHMTSAFVPLLERLLGRAPFPPGVVTELLAGGHVAAAAAVMSGDRAGARLMDIPPEYTEFWDWAADPDLP